jgi:hypothetical protein
MKITLQFEPSFDNEIRFYDACKGAITRLKELADKALDDGDYEQFLSETYDIVEENDDAEVVGKLWVRR